MLEILPFLFNVDTKPNRLANCFLSGGIEKYFFVITIGILLELYNPPYVSFSLGKTTSITLPFVRVSSGEPSGFRRISPLSLINFNLIASMSIFLTSFSPYSLPIFLLVVSRPFGLSSAGSSSSSSGGKADKSSGNSFSNFGYYIFNE